MAVGQIKVGIIGASPERGWAQRAHVPALRALPRFTITAVGTTRAESAARAAEQYGAAHAFTDPRRLAEHPDVDLVSITVKVPGHAELVRAALDAGKHVYCEWPLALTTTEAEELARAAEAAGVHNVVGLQARQSPAFARARELIAEGHLGRVTSVNAYVSRSKGAAERIPGWSAYTYDVANGAGLLEVSGGHTLDLLEQLTGGIGELSATLSVQHPHHVVAETGEPIEATSPDHLVLNATTTSSAVMSAVVHDGATAQPETRIEVRGTRGDLALTSPGDESLEDTQLQVSELRLRERREPGQWRDLDVPNGLPTSLTAAAPRNVARLYAEIAEGIDSGTQTAPDFAAGVRLHRLLDAIRLSADSGMRQQVE
ncbi:Gfo/Idh/MocA family oxidoreductase [Saccharopolyspora taberi]|uniref:Gfo/Idh/MocA family oxidoreductase n=1 Tax=Saccharopolyspora taberi TaxID=60895 RepID=A0ABN3VN70_9PSEU